MPDKGSQLSEFALKIVNGDLTQQDINNETPNISNVAEANGWEYLFTKYPNDFEYYAIAFELIDSEGQQAGFFSLPVMPESIRISTIPLTSIRQTMTGRVISTNPTFAVKDIKLQGNFGRKFRRIKADVIAATSQNKKTVFLNNEQNKNFGTENGIANEGKSTGMVEVVVGGEFDSDWKTGYACNKIMEGIFEKAPKADTNNGSHKLFFYNLSFNQAFMVEVVNFDFSQSTDRNRIWQYDISLKAVGPASAFNANARNTKKQLLQMTKVLQAGNKSAIQGSDALGKNSNGTRNIIGNKKLQKLLDTEVGKRVYQVRVAYQPDILRTAFQLAEQPDSLQYFVPNAGNNILNTGAIF